MRRAIIAGIGICTFASGRTLLAQIGLQWPRNTIVYTNYRTVEECLAATARMQDSITRLDMVLRDTMPWSTQEAAGQQPSAVTGLAQRCSARFDARSVAFNDGWDLLIELFLQAGRDDDARLLWKRRIAAAGSDSGRSAILDTTIAVYQRIRPAQLTIADSLLEERSRLPAGEPPFVTHIVRNGMQMQLARIIGDSVLARRAAVRVEHLTERLTEEDKITRAYVVLVKNWVERSLNYLSRDAALDSLRHSTAGYLTLQQSVWAKALGRLALSKSSEFAFPMGKHASPIQGDFWFSSTLSSQASQRNGTSIANSDLTSQRLVRPSPGRVSLIVFLSHECGAGRPPSRAREDLPNPNCVPTYAALRRIGQKFPELEITIVAQTFGFFFEAEPPLPEDEATMLKKWWLDFHQLPGTLAVTQTPFWRLPDPDRRRIDNRAPNEENYALGNRGKNSFVTQTTAFLVDRSGIIVHRAELGSLWWVQRLYEYEFTQLIDILVHRPDGKTAAVH